MSDLVVGGRDRMVETALVTAVQARGERTHPVGIWVVCSRARQVVACQFVARLDIDPAVFVPAESTGVVLIAVAPCRVSDAVIARVDVVYDFLHAHGVDVRAVYAPTLVPGGMWSSLRGTAMDGIVPLDAAQPLPLRRPPRLPFLGRGRHRWTAAAMAPLAALVFTLPDVHAAPTGQPGITPPRPGTGQAGVTAPPSAKSIGAARPAPSQTGFHGSSSLAASTGSSSANSATASAPAAEPIRASDFGFTDDGDATASPDTVRIAVLSFPRPQWIPAELATSERAWNAFAATTAASILATAGSDDSAIGSALGADEGQASPVPEELEPVAAIVPDLTEAPGLPGPLLEWVEQVELSVADVALAVTT
ncbi:hypothetical protein [Nocardia sp. XZ_19_369]|uniref:hypothetical protein n=1 Tax=Nocardia sp. XZ_19_369 TaxID=2769487 RepID=UPI001890A26E|nr:hypothetical protein [Nocardia sp. XZ_19_369]